MFSMSTLNVNLVIPVVVHPGVFLFKSDILECSISYAAWSTIHIIYILEIQLRSDVRVKINKFIYVRFLTLKHVFLFEQKCIIKSKIKFLKDIEDYKFFT